AERRKLAERVDWQAGRIDRAAKERRTLLAQTRYLGTIGILLVLPIVAGAYFGRWLDGFEPGYSVRWTAGMIFLGVVAGGVGAWLFVRE
ncbi:MAG TPA: AtpZ/AtpI family protein, partial [Bryobacteraceae bacterium]|nr:AtpZ/AtpI family protein [Bryobacteraceae bacterium]